MRILLTLCLAAVAYFAPAVLAATGKELLNDAIEREKQLRAQDLARASKTQLRASVIELYSGAIASGQLERRDRNNALVRRARLYADDKNCALAIRDLSDAIDSSYRSSLAYALRAFCYREVGSLEPARKDLDSSIALNPKDPILFRERATILIAQKKYENAEKDISASMKALRPAVSADLYVMRGDVAFAQEKYERAIANYVQAIHVTKENVKKLKLSGPVVYLAPIYEKLASTYQALSRANAQGK